MTANAQEPVDGQLPRSEVYDPTRTQVPIVFPSPKNQVHGLAAK